MSSDHEMTPRTFLTGLSQRIRRPIETLLAGEGLKAKVFRGGAWLGTGSFSEQVVRFGRNMVLARLLAPEAFGMMAVVLSGCSVIHTIMDIGVKEALIQNPRGSDDEYVGAAWWMAFGRAISFGVCLFIAAPFIAKFYGNAELSPLFRVSAIGVLLDGAMSSRAFVAIREMKFRKWAIINHGGSILGVLITVGLSFFIRDVWALVIGYCSESGARCVLSFIVCPYLPPRRWPMAAIRDLLSFSRKAFGLALLNLIFARTDIFVLAKLHSAAELGLYSMAILLVQTPTSFLMNLLGQTLLPAFSQVQEDRARTNRILIQVTSVLLLAGMPALVFVVFCGHSLLTLAYGHRYSVAEGPLIVASFVALFNALNGQVTSIFYAKGQPHLHRRCVVIMAITMIVLIYPSIERFGLVGGQLAALLAVLAGFLFQVARLRGLIGLDLAEYGKPFLVAAGISVAVAVVCLSTRPFASLSRPVPNIFFGIVGCAVAYGFSFSIFYREHLKGTA
jgi:O-antigen/teichoic acid export membrane protein